MIQISSVIPMIIKNRKYLPAIGMFFIFLVLYAS